VTSAGAPEDEGAADGAPAKEGQTEEPVVVPTGAGDGDEETVELPHPDQDTWRQHYPYDTRMTEKEYQRLKRSLTAIPDKFGSTRTVMSSSSPTPLRTWGMVHRSRLVGPTMSAARSDRSCSKSEFLRPITSLSSSVLPSPVPATSHRRRAKLR